MPIDNLILVAYTLRLLDYHHSLLLLTPLVLSNILQCSGKLLFYLFRRARQASQDAPQKGPRPGEENPPRSTLEQPQDWYCWYVPLLRLPHAALTTLRVGLPNVGKSSFFNALSKTGA